MRALPRVTRSLAVPLAALALAAGLAPGAAQASTTARRPVEQLSLSGRGATFIGTFEGFVATAYDDPGGNCTIGFGHLIHLGACTDGDRSAWGTITRARGLRMLRSDADSFASGLRSRLAGHKLDQGEFDALVSFTYNIGLGGFDSSSVKADLLATPPKWGAVPKDLRLWVYSGGQFLCGLYKRRVDEGRLFRTGSYTIQDVTCPSGSVSSTASAVAASVAPGTAP